MISFSFKPYSLSLLGICCLWLYLLSVPALAGAGMKLAVPPQDKEDRQALLAAQELQRLTDPKDFVVTDSLMMACHARRNVPPQMVNVSSMRIEADELDAQKAIAWTEEYEPTAVIFWDDRLERMPEYVDWVQAHFRLARWFGKERRIYLPLSSPAQATSYSFGDEISLIGYTWSDATADNKGPRRLTLYWKAKIRPKWDYTLEIERLCAEGAVQETMRVQLAKDDLSASHWQEGDIVVASYVVPRTYGENVALSVMREGRHLEASDTSGRPLPNNVARLEEETS